MRIASWNILAGVYATPKAFLDVNPAVLPAPRRRAQVAAALKSLAPDVICLQEVDCDVEKLGLHGYQSVRAQRPGGRLDGCVVAWRQDKFEKGPAGHKEVLFDDFPPPASISENIAQYRHGNVGVAVQLRGKDELGEVVTVATTHLCWEPEMAELRSWQLRTFHEAINGFGGPRLVLCGDLNAAPETPAHSFLLEGCNLTSAYKDVEASAVTNSNASACAGGYCAMIDYIWYSAQWLTVKQRLRLPSRDFLCGGKKDNPVPTFLSERWPSDHLVLATDLVLTTGPVDIDACQ